MPYTVVAFEIRKPGMSPEAFADYYDNVHVPLIREVVGDAFPQKHSRYYIKRQPPAEGAEPDATPPPVIFFGTLDDVPYDSITIMEFEDFAAFLRFQEAYNNSPRKGDMDADEDNYHVKSKLKAFAVEDPHVTLH